MFDLTSCTLFTLCKRNTATVKMCHLRSANWISLFQSVILSVIFLLLFRLNFWLLKLRCIINFKVWNGTVYISGWLWMCMNSRIDHTCTHKFLCNFSTRTVSVHFQRIELLFHYSFEARSSVFEALSFSPSHSWCQFIEQFLTISQYVVVTYFLLPHLATWRNYLITTLHLNTTTT